VLPQPLPCAAGVVAQRCAAVADNVGRAAVSCAGQLVLTSLRSLPRVAPGDDLAALLCAALREEAIVLRDQDVLVVASKLVAKAEDRFVELSMVVPSPRAQELAAQTGKDPRVVEVVLWDSQAVSRVAKNALVVRHHGGHVSANAGLDQSNARGAGAGEWVLRLPADPDASARRLRAELLARLGAAVGVVISDSFGRPFRQGTVGSAIGVAGFPALFDQRGRRDLDGRLLEATITAPADQLAAACDLIAGQADEARGAVHVRGLAFEPSEQNAHDVCRPIDGDLYL
jgi:coenzyme F420-0:L-glutamate ligase/coenzyme F420-1:gamma-L-glutamate ligase